MIEMDKNSLFARVRVLLSEALDLPLADIPPDMAFGDLPQWDSLGHMEIMVRLEQSFEVEVSTDTIAELVSVPAICAYLENRNGQQLEAGASHG